MFAVRDWSIKQLTDPSANRWPLTSADALARGVVQFDPRVSTQKQLLENFYKPLGGLAQVPGSTLFDKNRNGSSFTALDPGAIGQILITPLPPPDFNKGFSESFPVVIPRGMTFADPIRMPSRNEQFEGFTADPARPQIYWTPGATTEFPGKLRDDLTLTFRPPIGPKPSRELPPTDPTVWLDYAGVAILPVILAEAGTALGITALSVRVGATFGGLFAVSAPAYANAQTKNASAATAQFESVPSLSTFKYIQSLDSFSIDPLTGQPTNIDPSGLEKIFSPSAPSTPATPPSQIPTESITNPNITPQYPTNGALPYFPGSRGWAAEQMREGHLRSPASWFGGAVSTINGMLNGIWGALRPTRPDIPSIITVDILPPDPPRQRPPAVPGVTRPVLLDLDGNGLKVRTLASSDATFDMAGDGRQYRTAWAGDGDGVLVLDLDGDGVIDRRNEVDFTVWDPNATSDMEALRNVFDTNRNGKLDAGDARWASFKVIVDGQVKTLAQLNIQSIDLVPAAAGETFGDGSVIQGTSRFTRTDGSTGLAGDVTFAFDTAGRVVQRRTTANADGSTTFTTTFLNQNGSKASETTRTVSASGRHTVIGFDGNGVVDRGQVIDSLANTDGSTTETVADTNADGSLKSRISTRTSADLKTKTVLLDQDGDGAFNTRRRERPSIIAIAA